MERAKAVKLIQSENLGEKGDFGKYMRREKKERKKDCGRNENRKGVEKEGKNGNKEECGQKFRNKSNIKECWQCGKKRHFCFECLGIREIRLSCSRWEKETMESGVPTCMQSRTFIINRINSNSGNFCYNEELGGGQC